MKIRIVNERGRNADAYDMYKLLGLKSNRLPADGMTPREIQGVLVYVKPSVPGTLHHRVYAVCSCGQHVPVGRIHQHICKVTEAMARGCAFGTGYKDEVLQGWLSIRIKTEQDARRAQGLPADVVASAVWEVIEADEEGREWVGAMGGLRYDVETKEWS
jgi:hypothetical protein